MAIVLPAAHRLAGKPMLTLAELRDDDWVQTSAASPCARHVVRSCEAAGFEPTPCDMSVARQKFLADARKLAVGLAEVRGCAPEEIAEITTRNFERLMFVARDRAAPQNPPRRAVI